MDTGTNPQNLSTIDDNATVIDWVSAIYGIFWGVWLGFFIDKVSVTEPIPQFVNWKGFILVGFSVLIFFYTYFLVKWLWIFRSLSPNQEFSFVFYRLRHALPLVILSIISILVLGWIFKISSDWVIMGALATSSWLILAASMVLSDRRGWR